MLMSRPFEFNKHFQQQPQNYRLDEASVADNNNNTNNSDSSTIICHQPQLDIDLGLDLDLDINPVTAPNAVSSPFSARSWLSSQGSPALPALEASQAVAIPPGAEHLFRNSPSVVNSTDPMHPDTWLSHSQLNTRPASRFSHNRESSLSSLGSTGPASPFSQTTSNPQIAVTDSLGDGFHGMHARHGLSNHGDDSCYQLAKSYAPSQDGNTFYPNYPTYQADPSATAAYTSMLASQQRAKSNRGLLPPPELSIGSSTRSRPVSVASSVASDSPATPSAGEPDDERRHRNGPVGLSVVPKLDRTMTDIYSDELYSPNFAINTSSPSQAYQCHIPVSPSNEMFAQRLQAANSQHLSATQSPVVGMSRDRSPFRNGSPLAPSPSSDFASAMSTTASRQRHEPHNGQPQQQQPARQIGFGSARQLRERRKAEQDAEAMRQQLARGSSTGTPQTISPKDAMLEIHDADSELDNFPLFPPGPATGSGNITDDQISKVVAAAAAAVVQDGHGFDTGVSMDTTGFQFGTPTQLPPGIQVPHQYPFVAVAPMPLSERSSVAPLGDLGRGSSSAPSHSSSSGQDSNSPGICSPRRPERGRSAEGGTYTCTYHGCTLRFDTPVLLQKHKREGHRQAHGVGGGSGRRIDGGEVVHSSGAGMTSSLLNTQAGPHRCDRINPSTGKSCNTIFSRPYDLTRHEDTIHNGRKQKVRCNLCTEDKTFSRADALTRHYRVCHPDVEFPGKHRRRAMQGNNQ